MKLAINFFCCFIALAASAEDFDFDKSCESVDLRSKFQWVRDQEDSGWCFANTSADLLSERMGFKVSASDLAMTFLLGDQNVLKRHPSPAIQKYLQDNPGFFRKLFHDRNSEPRNYSPQKILTAEGLVNTGGEEDSTLIMANVKGACRAENLPAGGWAQLGENLEKIRSAWKKDLPASGEVEPISMPMIGAISNPVAREMARRYQVFVDQRCSPRVPIPFAILTRTVMAGDSLAGVRVRIKNGEVTRGQVHRLILAEIQRQLNQNRAVAVGYDAYDLLLPIPGEEHAEHSSLIVARKKVNGICKYFVRNSFGKNCSIYRPEFQAACEKDSGGVWVSHLALPTLFSAISLEP